MKAVIAIDSLKGSLSSLMAGDAIRTGILRVDKNADIQIRPMADGGEGTMEALTIGMGGTIQTVSVTGPLGNKVNAQYGVLNDGVTAIMEMSAAAGITLVKKEEMNPLYTTTYGVGEIIRDAIAKGCRSFIVGIGGSATNDGGVGMLQALGYGFLNSEGRQIAFGAKGLEELKEITDDQVIPELAECSFRIACDVANPLCGNQGASAIYGPQKGASHTMIIKMDRWLTSYSILAKERFPKADPEYPGTGAAGGLGFAFLTFTNATLESGVHIVIDETKLEDCIKSADIVITGEGQLDSQSIMGKAPVGVAKLAKKYGKPVVAFAGCVTPDAAVCNKYGIDAFFPILRGAVTLQQAMNTENAYNNMADTAEQVFRLFMLNPHRGTLSSSVNNF